jgi:biotin carboxylase
MRAIHAVRELNEERAEPIRIIALHTESERHALFVRQADERHCLGPATVTGDDGKALGAYLDHVRLERALVETRADAAWVGWGFVAEDPAFAELCERLGIVFVGPDADVMRALGDKIEGKRLAERAGLPAARWRASSVVPIRSRPCATRCATGTSTKSSSRRCPRRRPSGCDAASSARSRVSGCR